MGSSTLKQFWNIYIFDNKSKHDFYYKLLIVFILILCAIFWGHILEIKYSHCVDFGCSLKFTLFSSLIITLGPLLYLLLSATYIIGLIVVGLSLSLIILIIIWLFFLKPKFVHLLWALIWLSIGFIIMHELVG